VDQKFPVAIDIPKRVADYSMQDYERDLQVSPATEAQGFFSGRVRNRERERERERRNMHRRRIIVGNSMLATFEIRARAISRTSTCLHRHRKTSEEIGEEAGGLAVI